VFKASPVQPVLSEVEVSHLQEARLHASIFKVLILRQNGQYTQIKTAKVRVQSKKTITVVEARGFDTPPNFC
jgi:hypothetical protein